jgi:hypothetical protein
MGSRLDRASISPFFIAATGGTDADPDIGGLGRLEPGLRHQIHHEKVGRRARRAHADLHALEVGRGFVARRLLLAHPDDNPGKAPELDHGLDVLTLGLHADGVLVGAGDDVDGAADQCLQRLRTAAEIIDGDVEALLLEIAEALADRQRQIIERGLAADREGHLFLLDGLAVRGPRERKRQREHGYNGFAHFHVLPAAEVSALIGVL